MFHSGVITSIQPHPRSAFNNAVSICAFAKECALHAVALRVEGYDNCMAVARQKLKIPLIGLVKTKTNALNTIITASHREALRLLECGVDYVAMECTGRCDLDRIQETVEAGIDVIADVADVEHAEIAEEIGCVAVTTALSGYINEKTHSFIAPDIVLVEKCVERVKIPVIAEGRYSTPEELCQAREAGAYAVCVGTAITDPKTIVLHNKICFDGSWKELAKNEYRELEYTR